MSRDICFCFKDEGEVPSRHHAETPTELVVRLGLAVDVDRVQGILDLAP